MASDFGTQLAAFLCELKFDVALPAGVEVLMPYRQQEVQRLVHEFCARYYQGSQPRLGMWGINPGRFGAGVTGICFTDPAAVSNQLGIHTPITGQREISAVFIEMVIDAYGGPAAFYRDVYVGALSPLGFVRDGRNVNFYDDPGFAKIIAPFIRTAFATVMAFGLRTNAALLIGSGALQKYARTHLADVFGSMTVAALEHPRFIMQYKRSQASEYVKRYVDTIRVYSQF